MFFGADSKMTNISTHTPREGRDDEISELQDAIIISTHTPREGRDECALKTSRVSKISTHTPREGRDSTFCVAEVRAPHGVDIYLTDCSEKLQKLCKIPAKVLGK